jgi:hypothetical protein
VWGGGKGPAGVPHTHHIYPAGQWCAMGIPPPRQGRQAGRCGAWSQHAPPDPNPTPELAPAPHRHTTSRDARPTGHTTGHVPRPAPHGPRRPPQPAHRRGRATRRTTAHRPRPTRHTDHTREHAPHPAARHPTSGNPRRCRTTSRHTRGRPPRTGHEPQAPGAPEGHGPRRGLDTGVGLWYDGGRWDARRPPGHGATDRTATQRRASETPGRPRPSPTG